MDNKKIGELIRTLRKEKNLTQEALAELIPIGREAVSKWERGKNKPDKNTLNRLSQIFDISIEELILGKRNIDNTEKKDITLNLYEDGTIKDDKIKKLTISNWIIVIGFIMIFLIYYFLTNFNSIQTYTINHFDDKITIENGIFNLTKEKIYFYLGDISTTKNIKSLKLYYIQDNEEKLIIKTDDLKIVLHDFYGYDEYFNYNKCKYIIKNLYLEIEFEDELYKIKLKPKKEFANNKIFYIPDNKIFEDNQNNQTTENKFAKLKDKLDFKDGQYIHKEKNMVLTILEDESLINLIINDKNNKKEWFYYMNNNFLTFSEYEDKKVLYSFSYFNNEYTCDMGECHSYDKMVGLFFNKLNNILKIS